MGHVVVRIGERDEVYGTVESTPRGVRYHPETPEKRGHLMSFITACHDGQDVMYALAEVLAAPRQDVSGPTASPFCLV